MATSSSGSAQYKFNVDLSSSKGDVIIAEALIATNKLLHDIPFDSLLRENMDDRKISKNMSKIVIKWCENPSCQDCCEGALGHTERKTTQTILLNYKLKRLCDVKDGKASSRTKFLLAVTIYHEISHLYLRWQNINFTPTKFMGRIHGVAEAGEYSEIRALGGVVQLEVIDSRRTRQKRKTSLNLEQVEQVEGVLLRPRKGTIIKRVDDDFIEKMLNPKNKSKFKLDVDDGINCKVWKRSKNHRCLKSGADEDAPAEIEEEPYDLPPGHYIYEPPPKRR
jgi:hypothetical protein